MPLDKSFYNLALKITLVKFQATPDLNYQPENFEPSTPGE